MITVFFQSKLARTLVHVIAVAYIIVTYTRNANFHGADCRLRDQTDCLIQSKSIIVLLLAKYKEQGRLELCKPCVYPRIMTHVN